MPFILASILAGAADKPHAAKRAIPWAAAWNASPPGYVRRIMTSASLAPLTVYSTTWCGYCHRLTTALKANGIAYDEVNIEDDSAAAEFVSSVNGGNRTVPTVRFADGSTLTNPSAGEVKAKLAEVAG
jgi:mycoredoxin